MDKVRFGRALGYGARHAAKTLSHALDAATSPSPKQVQQAKQVTRTATAAKTQAKQSFGGFFSTARRLSGVVWLQVTGTFFAIFALAMAQGVWHLRAQFHGPISAPNAQKLYLYLTVCLLFTYFTISSFVRAHRREAAKGHPK